MRVCILGDSGLLGQTLVQKWAAEPSESVLGISSSDFQESRFWKPLKGYYEHRTVDLLRDKEGFLAEVKRFKPRLLINCVALTHLAECERNKDLAERLNARLPEALAEAVEEQGIDFIHFSSDQVFDGRKRKPYQEGDPLRPVNWYGRTKQSAEEGIGKRNSKALIVRTNIVGFRDRKGNLPFAEWLCQSLIEGKEITLFEDYVTSPIHVRDLSDLVRRAYDAHLSGILHLAARDSVSKYELGYKFAAVAGLDFSKVRRGRLRDSGLVPVRPGFLALDVSRGEEQLGLTFPSVADTVKNLSVDFKVRFKRVNHATDSNKFPTRTQN